MRPDAIVKLAGGRRIVIDAKVPFTAYLAAAEAAGVKPSAPPTSRSTQRSCART